MSSKKPGRIADLEPTRINADYWVASAYKAKTLADARLFLEQAVNAWKNAAYYMADQRDGAINKCADVAQAMQLQWHDSEEEDSGHWMDAAQMIEDEIRKLNKKKGKK